jgi:hypothetical protein
MAGQTSYSTLPAVAIAGQIGNGGPNVIDTGIIEDTAGIGFGLFCIQGANQQGIAAMSGTDMTVVRGITTNQHNESGYPFTAGSAKYLQGETVNVLRRGRIWVQTNSAVTLGLTNAALYVVNTGADAGKIRNDNTNAVALAAGAIVRDVGTAGSGAGICEIEINLPQ